MTTKPTWPETAVAGKVFAILTASDGLFVSEPLTLRFESATIDKGVIRLDLDNGTSFELTVRQVA